MAISGTSTDYTARTLDMYVSSSSNLLLSGATPVYYSFGIPTRYIAGVQKLVQRYVIGLMNSGFPEEIIGANSGNIQIASHLFNLYSWDVITAFQSYQNANPGGPADESLQTVQLLSTTISMQPISVNPSTTTSTGGNGSYVNFNAQLLTQAGTTVAFLLPLSTI